TFVHPRNAHLAPRRTFAFKTDGQGALSGQATTIGSLRIRLFRPTYSSRPPLISHAPSPETRSIVCAVAADHPGSPLTAAPTGACAATIAAGGSAVDSALPGAPPATATVMA